VKTVKITYEGWEAVLEIASASDLGDLGGLDVRKGMEEQLLFWMSGKERIARAGGDIELAYLRMLGQVMIAETLEWNLTGVLAHFAEAEGWDALDGSRGVRLLRVSEWEFEEEGFFVEAVG